MNSTSKPSISCLKALLLEFDELPSDDFDPANPYPVAMMEMREHLVRENWIDIEATKILRDKVKWCYHVEGISHLQKCRHLAKLAGARMAVIPLSMV